MIALCRCCCLYRCDTSRSSHAAGKLSCVQWQYGVKAGCAPVLLRERAGEAALLSLEGALLAGREGGRVAAGDGPLLILGLSGRAGAALRAGLHSKGPC